ncbi:MAG TPA: hypothetical protein ENK66_08915 [Arcobacter sp.]|jgi:TRAP-type uncharacterized transport system substrate-binding protein|nr:hypothetical protein [Arcobacter sp.]
MKKFLILLVFISTMSGYELGTIATASKTGMYYKLGIDISDLLKKYDINIKPISTGGSYENLDILNGHYIKNNNTFFAIVQKDAINYYNFLQYKTYEKSIYHKMPAVLSLGVEQIHIMTLEGNEYDFDQRKTFKVYCGTPDGGSCITAKYIEKAYGFDFVYVNSKFEKVYDKMKSGMVDLVINVIETPAAKFQDLQGVKLIDLPTNFVMEDMYTHSIIKKEDYKFLSEDIHAFAVPKVLVTNLSDSKYNPVIENLVKLIVLNKPLLEKEYGEYWKNIDFFYTKFKKMVPIAKKTLENIQKSQ